jgi:acetyl esterase/lipase
VIGFSAGGHMVAAIRHTSPDAFTLLPTRPTPSAVARILRWRSTRGTSRWRTTASRSIRTFGITSQRRRLRLSCCR